MTDGSGMRSGLLDVAVTVSTWSSFAAPAVTPERDTDCDDEFSSMVMLLRESRVGVSLAALTVTVKARVMVLFCGWPSLTVTVMVAAPNALVRGVKTSVPVALGLV